MSRKYLDRSAILNADDLQTEEIEVPEWGGYVLVRGLTGSERDRFDQSLIKDVKGKKNQKTITLQDARARLVAYSVIDDQGKRLFNDADILELTRKSAAALDRVYEVAARLSGISDEDIEEITENLGGDPNDASG